MASDSDDKLPPQGRLTRLRKLAGLSAQLGADVLKTGARRLAGQEPELITKGMAEKLVATLGELKGAAMKFGQAVSMDPDLLTPEVRQVLARLQNQAPAMGYDTVARVIREELGAPPEALFREFHREPLAAASLGQVHRAVLEDGRPVVVKVQYPGVGDSLQGDLDNLGMVVKTLSKASKAMDGTAYFQELREEFLLELDYRREARLCLGFARGASRLPDLLGQRQPEGVAGRVEAVADHSPSLDLQREPPRGLAGGRQGEGAEEGSGGALLAGGAGRGERQHRAGDPLHRGRRDPRHLRPAPPVEPEVAVGGRRIGDRGLPRVGPWPARR